MESLVTQRNHGNSHEHATVMSVEDSQADEWSEVTSTQTVRVRVRLMVKFWTA